MKKKTANDIRKEFRARKDRIHKQTKQVVAKIMETCPLQQCADCDHEFDNGTVCPRCGSGAVFKHTLRISGGL